jgi:hypothetical protein
VTKKEVGTTTILAGGCFEPKLRVHRHRGPML